MRGKTKAKVLAHHKARRIDGHKVGYLTFSPKYKADVVPQPKAWIDGKFY